MLYGAMNSPLHPILDELEVIAKLGFDYLELAMDPPHAHYRVIREQKRKLLNAFERLDMRPICHLPTFLSTADITESLREASIREMLMSLRVAFDLKPLKVVVHPSFIQGLGIMMTDQAKIYAMEALQRIMYEADRSAIPVCIENLFPRSLSLVEPDDFIAVFTRFPAAKLALDTGHANIGGRGCERTLAFIEKYSDRIGHLHASDNSGREDEHLPIGVGSINFQNIIKALKVIGYNSTVTLEVFSQDRDYLRISREKLAEMFLQL